jgi:hypothetical protein
VPPYNFDGDSAIMIGQNPPGDSFQISQIETL